MRIWQWMAAALTLVLLAACQPIVPPVGGGTVPPAPQEPAGLIGVTWEWQRTQAADGAEIVAQDPSRYTLTFREGGRVDVQLDCNGGSGDYFVEGDSLTFGALVSTLMGCPEDSQADDFSEGLSAVTSFAVDAETLTLGLVEDGEMVFRAAGAEAAATPATTEETAGEGESPTEDMTAENPLVGTTWLWIETQYGDGSVLAAADPARYTLTFQTDGSVAAQVDCNQGSGPYTVEGSSLTIGPLITTRMACPEGSQAELFLKDLEAVATFVYDGSNLVLNLKLDSGNMIFAPVV